MSTFRYTTIRANGIHSVSLRLYRFGIERYSSNVDRFTNLVYRTHSPYSAKRNYIHSSVQVIHLFKNMKSFEQCKLPWVDKQHKVTWVNRVHKYSTSVYPDDFHKLPQKCSSCGARLQNKYATSPGYIEENEMSNFTSESMVCLNCQQIHLNKPPIVVGTNPISDIKNQLNHIRRRSALILYIVDLCNIDGTVLPHITSLVGRTKRLIIVGNKIDQIPRQDKRTGSQQLESLKDILKDAVLNCLPEGVKIENFRDICLVSGKTGFGMKPLVEKIVKHRDGNQDIYLVGTMNTGKSTLYNSLINLMNVEKRDLPEQAIVHSVPGSTQALVRQSISSEKLNQVHKRLAFGEFVGTEESDYVGTEENTSEREKECYVYDTPGVDFTRRPKWITEYMYPSEVENLSLCGQFVPRVFLLRPGTSLLIDGIARLDYPVDPDDSLEDVNLSSQDSDPDNSLGIHSSLCNIEDNVDIDETDSGSFTIYVTVMIPQHVPVIEAPINLADKRVKQLSESKLLRLLKQPGRLDSFTKLEKHDYNVVGEGELKNVCDLVLHGMGWLSVSAEVGIIANIALHTPEGKCQGYRQPLLTYYTSEKGLQSLETVKFNSYLTKIFHSQNTATYSMFHEIKSKLRRKTKQNIRNDMLKEKSKERKSKETSKDEKMEALKWLISLGN